MAFLWSQKLQFSEYFLALLCLCLPSELLASFKVKLKHSFLFGPSPHRSPFPNWTRSLPPFLRCLACAKLGLSCHWVMSLPKVKGALLHLCGFSIQSGPLHIISDKWTFAEGMCDCYMCVSFRIHVFAPIKKKPKTWYLKQSSLPVALARGSANYVHRPTSSLWSVLARKLQMIFTFWKT